MNFVFSKEVRLGEIVSAVLILGGGAGVYAKWTSELDQVKQAQAAQVIVNSEMRTEFRAVSQDIKTDIRELRQEVRTANVRRQM